MKVNQKEIELKQIDHRGVEVAEEESDAYTLFIYAIRSRGNKDPNWAFSCIVIFLQYQKERVLREEITGATLRNFVKAIKLFCEMSDVTISWKKINRGLPKIRRFADDRAPTLEEIQKISEYPDRRIKGIVYIMASSGVRLGAWDYMHWKHIQPIKRDGKIVAAKQQ